MTRSRVTLAMIEAAAIAALLVSPSTTARCAGASGPSRKPSTRHASAGGARSERTERKPQRLDLWRPFRSMSVGDGADPSGLRSRRPRKSPPLGGRDLLGVVQRRERANTVVAEAVVVEQHAGHHEGACEGAAAGLVGTCDEACSELPVVREELLTYGTGHDSDCSRCRGRRLQRLRRESEADQKPSTQPASRSSSAPSHPLPCAHDNSRSRLERRTA